ncbi:MAG: glycine cleavage system protein GcvH [Xanthobacteraceae bacterium]|jgi:glycine cleavage system H protein
MPNVRYTRDHEWIRLDGDVGTVGITNYAQTQLGDIVFVELPEVGRKLAKGSEAAVVESVKAASDIYAPASGEVIEVNDALEGAPATVNEDAEGKGWFMRVKLTSLGELEDLMTAEAYEQYVESISRAPPVAS